MVTGINIYGGYVGLHNVAERKRVIVIGLIKNGGWCR